VVTCFDDDGGVHGMTANSFVTVSTAPPTVLVSVKQGGRMHALLSSRGRYGISVLGADDEVLSRHFAGRPDDTVCPVFHDGIEVPILRTAIAHFVCGITQRVAVHDHTLFIARVTEWAASPRPALLFYRSRCHPVLVHEEGTS